MYFCELWQCLLSKMISLNELVDVMLKLQNIFDDKNVKNSNVGSTASNAKQLRVKRDIAVFF